MDFRPAPQAAIQQAERHRGWEMPEEVQGDHQLVASPPVPVLQSRKMDRLQQQVVAVVVEEELGVAAVRTCLPSVVVLAEELPEVAAGRTCLPLVAAEELPGVAAGRTYLPSVVAADPSCPSGVAAVLAEKNSSPVCSRCGQEPEPGHR
jgi:hypothetical protein